MRGPLSLSFILALFFCSCQKSQLNKSDTSIAEDHTLAQMLWDDVANQVNSSSIASELKSDLPDNWSNCATVTVDSSSSGYPLTITLDFGEENCTGMDGRNRRGRLIYTITGKYMDKGTVISLESNDYYVNDYRIEGTRVMENQGENNDGHVQFRVVVSDGVITTPDNKTITWESELTTAWAVGSETDFWSVDEQGVPMGVDGLLDDVYQITGTGSGTNSEGRSFDMEITSPLFWELACRWITQGEIRLKPDDLEARVIDYGNGNCDNEAVVKIGVKEYPIQLHQ